jgi:hypothetical protein
MAQEPDKAKIDVIDWDISRAMAHAMNKIRKICASPFSPQSKQARRRRWFYNIHLSMRLNNLDFQSKLVTLTQELDKELPEPSNLKEARQLLHNAQKNVREITKRAKELRVTFLEDQAQNVEADDKEKAGLIQKRIIKAKETKKMYMKLLTQPQLHIDPG